MSSYYEKVAQELIKQLKEGTAVWIKPWKPGTVGNIPYNPNSGKAYNGMNAIWLASSGYSDPRWMTYKQAREEGAQVRKGEKGTVIQYWKWQGERIARDEAGNVITDENGQAKKEYYKLSNPQIFNAVVFNAEQIEGLKPLQSKEIPQWEIQEKAEKVLNNSPVAIYNDQANRAYYTPSRDEIHLPPRENFKSVEGYYATALHEIGHSTGHPTRLNRDLSHPFGSVEYAKEELRAEIASYMLGMELGIGHNPGQHTAYVESWIKVLNDDPKEIFRASRDAQKIKEYVMSLIQEQEITQTIDNQQDPLENKTKEQVNNTSLPGNDEVVFLAIPYAEKEQAKALARENGFRIRWDKENNCWTAPKNADLSTLSKWINPNTTISNTDDLIKKQEAKDKAIKEFKEAIIDMGLEIDGDPLMDEKIHRVKVNGDKGSDRSGAYAGFLNENGGIPGGYIQNFKTGERFNWRSNVALPKLSPEERASIAKQQAEKKLARDAEDKKYFEATINVLANHLKNNMVVADNSHPYLVSKDVPAMPGMFIDNKGLEINKQHFSLKGDLIIPIVNMNGELVSAQSIKPDGTKSYLKGGHKQGGFFILGDITNSKDIIFAEGLATGETVYLNTNKPTVITFDSGNLVEVSKSFKDAYNNKSILIASDNDQLKTLELDPKGRPKKNTGLEAGLKAVEQTNGQMLYPPLKMTDKGSDWNDYQKIYGKEAVKKELDNALAIAYRNFEVSKISKEREEKHTQDNKQSLSQKNTQAKTHKLSIS